MGRSQLKFTRRARGRGAGPAGRGGRGDGTGGGGGGGGGRGGPSRRQQQVTEHLPSNDFRFQRGGSQGGAGAGRAAEESDDLRAYAVSTDTRTAAYHACGLEGEDAGGEPLALPSLTLDLAALAEALSQLPAHVRLGGAFGDAEEGDGEEEEEEDGSEGRLDPAYTEGLRYWDGVTVRAKGGTAAGSTPANKPTVGPPPPTREASAAREPPQPQQHAPLHPRPSAAAHEGDDEALEALLGLSLDGAAAAKGTGGQRPTPAAAVDDDIDALLALGSGPSSKGPVNAAAAAPVVGAAKDDIDALLSQPAPGAKQTKGTAANKLSKPSSLDSGGY